jgi:hypothetical protein
MERRPVMKIRTLSLTTVLVCLSSWLPAGRAESPPVLWERHYGGAEDDKGYSAVQTLDGGYILVGQTSSIGAGSLDVYLVKTDSNGGVIWERAIGGTDEDIGYGVTQTSDEGYIITGSTFSFGAGSNDVYLVKTDANGDTTWTRTFGGANTDHGRTVRQTMDGGYIIAGSTKSTVSGNSRLYLLKTDEGGSLDWSRTYGEGNNGFGHEVHELSGGGFATAGMYYPSPPENRQFYLVKTTAEGDTTWTRGYGGPAIDWGYGLDLVTGGGYILSGYTLGDGTDAYLIRTDVEGDTLWTRRYGGVAADVGFSIRQCPDGGFIMVGWTESYGSGAEDVYLLKVNADGDFLWSETYGSGGYDKGRSIELTSDGGYVVAGHMWRDINSYDACLIRFGAEAANAPENQDPPPVLLTIRPNPFTTSSNITLELTQGEAIRASIYNTLGRHIHTLLEGTLRTGRHVITWNGRNDTRQPVSPGIYFLRLEVSGKTISHKIIRVY